MGKELKTILDGIVAAADKEREQSEPYKDLFKSSDDLESLIYHLSHKMTTHVLNASKVLKDKFGYDKVPDEAFYFLLAVPFLDNSLKKHVVSTQGSSVSSDKVRYHLAKELRTKLAQPLTNKRKSK